MICRECGAKIEDDAVKCKFCGAVYAENEVYDEPVPEETYGADDDVDIEAIMDENEAKRVAQIDKISSEKKAQLQEIEKRRVDKKRRQRRNRFLIILLVLLCGVAVAACVYYINPTTNSDADNDITVVTSTPDAEPTATATPDVTMTPEPTIGIVGEDESEQTPEQENVSVVVTPAPVKTAAPKATKAPAKPSSVATPKPVATKKPTSSVPKKSDITSALVTGIEVVKDNGKTYMSFNYNGEVCYAKVSDNTTNNFIAGKQMTLTANKSSETYNGKPVYVITNITHYNNSNVAGSSYILPESGIKLLSTSDLQGLNAQQLRIARNEIYARHGRTFKDAELQNYFASCSWYKPNSAYNYANENSNLNSIEKQNVITIKNYEDSIR